MPSASQDGQTTSPCAPARARASRSASRAKSVAPQTSATYGPSSVTSSRSASLQSRLANRLRARMGATGSPEYVLTWKDWDMKSGAADLCAAGVAAPQLRQRLYWMANPTSMRRGKGTAHQRRSLSGSTPADVRARSADGRNPAWMGDANDAGSQGWRIGRDSAGQWTAWSAGVGVCGDDGTWRRVEPGVPPLAPRLPGRVALIRGSGNAIVPQLAAEFVEACVEALT